MKDDGLKDYSNEAADNSHYCVPSTYGKRVKQQYDMLPKYAEPGMADGEMMGEHSNPQKGP